MPDFAANRENPAHPLGGEVFTVMALRVTRRIRRRRESESARPAAINGKYTGNSLIENS
ncbi:MAG: hypothetical protein LBP76_04510 [Treponema sp.]|nr:hypothetical protein [Treponema sp.]